MAFSANKYSPTHSKHFINTISAIKKGLVNR